MNATEMRAMGAFLEGLEELSQKYRITLLGQNDSSDIRLISGFADGDWYEVNFNGGFPAISREKAEK